MLILFIVAGLTKTSLSSIITIPVSRKVLIFAGIIIAIAIITIVSIKKLRRKARKVLVDLRRDISKLLREPGRFAFALVCAMLITSLYAGALYFCAQSAGRIHNVALAAEKINGVLVPPGEEFSFVKNLGDVTQYTGYQQAYIIQNGKTVLGDGGGVCQVSTTLFRALLNAGLPITNRVAHAYRVGYYEQDSPPGLDATVYYPTVDLKFKNDTENYILILAHTDLDNLRLTFNLYGKKDGREVSMSTPVVTSQTPAPEASYQDDPTLPRGQVKQVDFAADGATVVFSRKVTKNGKVVIADSYKSVYRPWQAIFLRGTKEG
jgi:vancomycin resistance protein YoaR